MSRSLIESIATEGVLRHINRSTSRAIEDEFINNAPEGTIVRNMCAKVSSALIDQVDHATAFLGINKRSFIEAAVIDALEKVRQVEEQEGLDLSEHFDAIDYPLQQMEAS